MRMRKGRDLDQRLRRDLGDQSALERRPLL